MTNIDEIKARAAQMKDRLTSEVITPYSDLDWAATTILELCERVESLRTEVEALNQQILELEMGDDL